MSKNITATHERVDDIPVIIAHLKKMCVADCLDNHFLPNGNWQGLSLGKTTVVWLAVMLSEGDHRRYRVEPWGKAPQRTLSRCLGSEMKPRDLTDDRLATTLDSRSAAERWGAFERDLNQSVLRVSDVQGRVVRIDTTTAGASVTPAGMFPLGHRKHHRPDLPQVQSAMAVLDPLGLPLTTTVVAGQTADDPRSLPEMAQVRQTAQRSGLTSVGDGQMAALGTRAESVAHQDDSLGPLSAKQLPDAELERLLAPVFSSVRIPRDMRLPNANGQIDETDDPVAVGGPATCAQRGQEQHHQRQMGTEPRVVVRALAFAASQEQPLRQRVARAVPAINVLEARQQGTPRVPDEATASQAAAAILATHRVEGLVHVTVALDVLEPTQRRYGTRPATTVRSERVRGGGGRRGRAARPRRAAPGLARLCDQSPR